MLYLIAEQLGFPGVLNLIRYISFRAGAASATALADRPVARAVAHFLAARAAGQGPADPRRRAAKPPRQARHADHGRPADPDLDGDVGPAVDGPSQPLRLGVPSGHRRLRDDRVPRRLRQGEEGAPCGLVGQDPARARVPDRRLRDLADRPGGDDKSLSSVRAGTGGRPRLVLHRVRRLRDRRIRQCGEPDRRARRARDHAGDHRLDRLPADRLSRRQRALRGISRDPAHPRRRRPDGAVSRHRWSGPRLPVVQRAAGCRLHGRHWQPCPGRSARSGRRRDAP